MTAQMLQILLQDLVWGVGATIVSQLITYTAIGLALQQGPWLISKEIVEDNNGAIGAIFVIISLIVGVYAMLTTINGFSSEFVLGEYLFWTAFAFVTASIMTTILIWASCIWFAHSNKLHGKSHKPETVRQFLKRELIIENNVGLGLYIMGLALPPFLVMLGIAISV